MAVCATLAGSSIVVAGISPAAGVSTTSALVGVAVSDLGEIIRFESWITTARGFDSPIATQHALTAAIVTARSFETLLETDHALTAHIATDRSFASPIELEVV